MTKTRFFRKLGNVNKAETWEQNLWFFAGRLRGFAMRVCFGSGATCQYATAESRLLGLTFPTRSYECVHVDLDVELLYFEAN